MGYSGGHSGLLNVLAERWYRFMYAQPVRGLLRSLTDLGEVAARLGAIPMLDRRGDVFWYDDCEVAPAVKWAVSVSGASSAVALSTTYARRGAASYQLTAGAAAGAGAATIYFPFGVVPVAGGLGFEAAFTYGANIAYVTMEVYRFTGAALHWYGVRYDVSNHALQYYSSGAYNTFATLGYSLFTGPPGWHRLKLVVDFENQKYVRCLLNDTEYDLSAYAPYTVAGAILPQVRASLTATAGSAVTGSAYVDDVAITLNEVEG